MTTDEKHNDDTNPSDGRQAIHVAALNGEIEPMTALLDGGVDIESTDDDGMTPLGYAVLGNQPAALRVLLERGANVNPLDSNGMSALHSVAFQGFVEMLKLLLEYGADMECQYKSETVLSGAVKNKHHEIVKILLSHGANAEHRDKNGWTSLHSAASEGDVEMMALLLDAGADIEGECPDGQTPLFFAVFGKSSEAVTFLLEKGANLHACDKNERQPVYTASLLGDLEKTKLLIEKGGDVNTRGKTGGTPLHMAAWTGNTEMMQLLLENGADVESLDSNDRTPLDCAMVKDKAEAVELLRQWNRDHADASEELPSDEAERTARAVKMMKEIQATGPGNLAFIVGGWTIEPLISCSSESVQWLFILHRFSEVMRKTDSSLGASTWEKPLKTFLAQGGEISENAAMSCRSLLRNMTRYLCYSRFSGATPEAILEEMARATRLIEAGAEYQPCLVAMELLREKLNGPMPDQFAAFSSLAVLEHIRQCELIETQELDDFVDFDPCQFGYILPRRYFEKLQQNEETWRRWQTQAGWTAEDMPLLGGLGNMFFACGFMVDFREFSYDILSDNPVSFTKIRKADIESSRRLFVCREIVESDWTQWTPDECRKRRAASVDKLMRFFVDDVPLAAFRAGRIPPGEDFAEYATRKAGTPISAKEDDDWRDSFFIAGGLQGFDIRDRDGATPLHWSAWNGDIALMSTLLEKGADLHAKDNEGKTPLDYARKTDNANAIKLLQEKLEATS